MKLRKVKRGEALKLQGKSQGRWIDMERVSVLPNLLAKTQCDLNVNDLLSILSLGSDALAELQTQLDGLQIIENSSDEIVRPFTPTSFRDFMLFETHVIDASRGYAKRFLPKAYPITQIIERLTGKPFKRFRPHPLWYKQPIYYLSNHLNIGVCGDDIHWPDYTNALDYELEIGAVISKPLFNATPEQALEAIGGFVVLNDFSARDVQKEEMDSGFGPQKAKHFISTISSVVVTSDEVLPHLDNLSGRVTINGAEVSRCHSSGMQFSLGEAIAFASKGEQLHSGELFGTGTLPGGGGLENGHWLSRGDTITLHIDRIGKLTNTIKANEPKGRD